MFTSGLRGDALRAGGFRSQILVPRNREGAGLGVVSGSFRRGFLPGVVMSLGVVRIPDDVESGLPGRYAQHAFGQASDATSLLRGRQVSDQFLLLKRAVYGNDFEYASLCDVMRTYLLPNGHWRDDDAKKRALIIADKMTWGWIFNVHGGGASLRRPQLQHLRSLIVGEGSKFNGSAKFSLRRRHRDESESNARWFLPPLEKKPARCGKSIMMILHALLPSSRKFDFDAMTHDSAGRLIRNIAFHETTFPDGTVEKRADERVFFTSCVPTALDEIFKYLSFLPLTAPSDDLVSEQNLIYSRTELERKKNLMVTSQSSFDLLVDKLIEPCVKTLLDICPPLMSLVPLCISSTPMTWFYWLTCRTSRVTESKQIDSVVYLEAPLKIVNFGVYHNNLHVMDVMRSHRNIIHHEFECGETLFDESDYGNSIGTRREESDNGVSNVWRRSKIEMCRIVPALDVSATSASFSLYGSPDDRSLQRRFCDTSYTYMDGVGDGMLLPVCIKPLEMTCFSNGVQTNMANVLSKYRKSAMKALDAGISCFTAFIDEYEHYLEEFPEVSRGKTLSFIYYCNTTILCKELVAEVTEKKRRVLSNGEILQVAYCISTSDNDLHLREVAIEKLMRREVHGVIVFGQLGRAFDLPCLMVTGTNVEPSNPARMEQGLITRATGVCSEEFLRSRVGDDVFRQWATKRIRNTVRGRETEEMTVIEHFVRYQYAMIVIPSYILDRKSSVLSKKPAVTVTENMVINGGVTLNQDLAQRLGFDSFCPVCCHSVVQHREDVIYCGRCSSWSHLQCVDGVDAADEAMYVCCRCVSDVVVDDSGGVLDLSDAVLGVPFVGSAAGVVGVPVGSFGVSGVGVPVGSAADVVGVSFGVSGVGVSGVGVPVVGVPVGSSGVSGIGVPVGSSVVVSTLADARRNPIRISHKRGGDDESAHLMSKRLRVSGDGSSVATCSVSDVDGGDVFEDVEVGDDSCGDSCDEEYSDEMICGDDACSDVEECDADDSVLVDERLDISDECCDSGVALSGESVSSGEKKRSQLDVQRARAYICDGRVESKACKKCAREMFPGQMKIWNDNVSISRCIVEKVVYGILTPEDAVGVSAHGDLSGVRDRVDKDVVVIVPKDVRFLKSGRLVFVGGVCNVCRVPEIAGISLSTPKKTRGIVLDRGSCADVLMNDDTVPSKERKLRCLVCLKRYMEADGHSCVSVAKVKMSLSEKSLYEEIARAYVEDAGMTVDEQAKSPEELIEFMGHPGESQCALIVSLAEKQRRFLNTAVHQPPRVSVWQRIRQEIALKKRPLSEEEVNAIAGGTECGGDFPDDYSVFTTSQGWVWKGDCEKAVNPDSPVHDGNVSFCTLLPCLSRVVPTGRMRQFRGCFEIPEYFREVPDVVDTKRIIECKRRILNGNASGHMRSGVDILIAKLHFLGEGKAFSKEQLQDMVHNGQREDGKEGTWVFNATHLTVFGDKSFGSCGAVLEQRSDNIFSLHRDYFKGLSKKSQPI